MKARRTSVALCALVLAATAACSSAGTPGDDVVGSATATAETTPQAEAAPTAEPSEPPAEPSEAAEDGDAAAAPDETVTITIVDFAFVVPTTVAPGAEVTVVNQDASYHTVTADDGAFDVGARQGEPATFTAPSEPGEYTFHCGPHPNMVATLVVG